MNGEMKQCDKCGGVGVVGDPSNKPGADVKTIGCEPCGGTGGIAVELGSAAMSALHPTFDVEQMEKFAMAHIAADRILRKVAMPPGWEATVALPKFPRASHDAVPGLGIGPTYEVSLALEYAKEAIADDRAVCELASQAAARMAAGTKTFSDWYKEISVEGATEFNMQRAWDDGRKHLLDALIGDRMADTRQSFEAFCRSIGKEDRDLERSAAYAARVTGNDYTWGDINQRWDSWKAATAAAIARQMADQPK